MLFEDELFLPTKFTVTNNLIKVDYYGSEVVSGHLMFTTPVTAC